MSCLKNTTVGYAGYDAEKREHAKESFVFVQLL
jgi:hypothetical protein